MRPHLRFLLEVSRVRAASEELLGIDAFDERLHRVEPERVVGSAEQRRVEVSDDVSYFVVVFEAKVTAYSTAAVLGGELLVPEVCESGF